METITIKVEETFYLLKVLLEKMKAREIGEMPKSCVHQIICDLNFRKANIEDSSHQN